MNPTDGYVRGIDYTHGYCAELAPELIRLACAARGVALPAVPLRYLELAFGQGVSLNIHAAACAGEFQGIDFNPAHTANAQALAAASGARVLADSFEAFLARGEVPQFEIIAMHATWSWISAVNRARLVEIVLRRLAPGGVFFISYNCMPGWASEVPLRHLLVQHADLAAAPGEDIAARIDGAIAFAQAVSAAGARFFRTHATLDAWLTDMRGRSHAYLAHEYFNRDWQPMPFAEVAAALAPAGLTFVAPAMLSDQLGGIGLPADACALLAATAQPSLRETLFDTLTNRRLRRDLYARGPAHLADAERDEYLRDVSFVLLQHPDHLPQRVTVTGGEAALDAAVIRPLVAALAEADYAPKSLRWLEAHPECSQIGFANLLHSALLLTSAGLLHPAQSRPATDAAAPRCAALNKAILERARADGKMAVLASPVTGAGVYAVRREMLFLRAISNGCTTGDEWARHAWECLKPDGDVPTRESLASDARAFARIRLPLLRALRVA